MWEFPTLQGFIFNNWVTIFFVLFTLFLAALGWAYAFSAGRGKNKRTAGKTIKYLAIAVLTTIAAIFPAGILFSSYGEIRQCRSVDPARVKAVRVTQMPSERLAGSKTVLFQDASKIRQGLEILKSAESRGRKKKRGAPAESFSGGYRIELVLDGDAPGPVLYYFSGNDRNEKIDVVIPDCAADSAEIERRADIYASPAFGGWLDDNVKPLFKEVF